MGKKRVCAYYSGMVQGVGFRFTAERLARQLDISGWAKNLQDGRVEVLGEAEEGPLNDFLERIRSGPLKQYIQKEEQSYSKATGEFDGFDIRF